ncbi:MAG: Gfo/Idh/MocA family oxidoreductase [Acetobacteraceae bacterium]|nr:Gfo/Idh/MocA family oxidoreductase [Acetobacteraceae bacterium]
MASDDSDDPAALGRRTLFAAGAAGLALSARASSARPIETNNCQVQGDPGQWRMKKALAGGGSLPDIGIYCLNTARALTGEEPAEVFARIHTPQNDPRFAEVEDTVSFVLRFPSGTIANCATSYSAFNSKGLRVQSERGWADLENAYTYRGQRLRVAKREGETQAIEQPRIRERNQFALEMDRFARCILEDRRPRTPGEEGLRDRLAMEAIYRSAATGQPVAMEAVAGLDASRGPEAGKVGCSLPLRALPVLVWLSGAPGCHSGAMTSARPAPTSPEDDDAAEREAMLAAVERGRAAAAAGQVVPHERVREWLLDMEAGGDAPLPQPDDPR